MDKISPASKQPPQSVTRSKGRPASLHDETLSRLRDYIVEGNLPEGERLSERHLCDTLKITRTPLREALKVLASEGMIELLPNKGARIRHLSQQNLEELFDLMGGLESLAGRLACERATDAEVEKIQSLHYDMYRCYLNKDMHGYFHANQQIHHQIVKMARNEALEAAYEIYAGRIRRLRFSANFARNQERWGEAVREHEAILHALKRRSGDELSSILFWHLRHKLAAATDKAQP